MYRGSVNPKYAIIVDYLLFIIIADTRYTFDY